MSADRAADPAVAWLAQLFDPAGRGHIRALLRVLLRLGWAQRRRMVPALVAALALSALALVPPALLAYLIDEAFPAHDAVAVAAIGATLAAAALTDAGMVIFQEYRSPMGCNDVCLTFSASKSATVE